MTRQPGQSRSTYERALHLAEAACKLESEAGYSGFLVRALAAAQFRLGRYEETLKSLERADKINRNKGKGAAENSPVDLALLAMTCLKLGKDAEAKTARQRLFSMMQDPGLAKDPEAQSFFKEVESSFGR